MGCYDAMDGESWVDEKLAARVGSLSIRRDDVTGSTGTHPAMEGCNTDEVGVFNISLMRVKV